MVGIPSCAKLFISFLLRFCCCVVCVWAVLVLLFEYVNEYVDDAYVGLWVLLYIFFFRSFFESHLHFHFY